MHADSVHPLPLVHSIPYAQYLRLRRNCTYDVDFKHQARELRERLLQRGYSTSLLRKAYNKAFTRERTSLLYTKSKAKDNLQTTKFITKDAAQHGMLRNCLERHWYLLSEDPTLGKYVKEKPEIFFSEMPFHWQ